MFSVFFFSFSMQFKVLEGHISTLMFRYVLDMSGEHSTSREMKIQNNMGQK